MQPFYVPMIPKKSTETLYDLRDFAEDKRILSFEEYVASLPPYDMLSTMPNEVKAMIIGKLDITSCLNLRTTSLENYHLVNDHAKIDIELNVRFVEKGHLKITAKETNQFEDALAIDVKKMGQKKFLVSTYDDSRQILHYRSLENSTMSAACFRTLGRIMKDRIFETKMLRLNLGPFNGDLDLGLKSFKIDTLSFKNCLRKNTIQSMFMNYNCSYETLMFDMETMVQTDLDVRRFLLNSVDFQWHYMDVIDKAYTDAFPLGYQVKTDRDAIRRTKKFLGSAEKRGFPMHKMDGTTIKKRAEQAYLGLMYLRSAYGEDPVNFLRQKYVPNYENTIEQLQHGIQNKNLRHGTIALLSAIFVQSCIAKGDIFEMSRVMFAALYCDIDFRNVNNERNAYEKLLKNVENLTRVNWNAERF